VNGLVVRCEKDDQSKKVASYVSTVDSLHLDFLKEKSERKTANKSSQRVRIAEHWYVCDQNERVNALHLTRLNYAAYIDS
jgi:hypothetical protein